MLLAWIDCYYDNTAIACMQIAGYLLSETMYMRAIVYGIGLIVAKRPLFNWFLRFWSTFKQL